MKKELTICRKKAENFEEILSNYEEILKKELTICRKKAENFEEILKISGKIFRKFWVIIIIKINEFQLSACSYFSDTRGALFGGVAQGSRENLDWSYNKELATKFLEGTISFLVTLLQKCEFNSRNCFKPVIRVRSKMAFFFLQNIKKFNTLITLRHTGAGY